MDSIKKSKLDSQWYTNYHLLKNFEKKTGGLPSRSYISDCGIKIGNWIGTQRDTYKKNNLSKERINLLEKIPGWYWKHNFDEEWENKYSILKKLYEEGIKISAKYITKEGIHIGNWQDKQRQDYKKKKISQYRIELLEKIPGWKWEQDLNDDWINKYNLLKNLNNGEIPLSFVTENGVKLGNWVGTQRQFYKKNKLSQERIKLLDKIPGWYWNYDKDEIKWKDNYELLKKYQKLNGILPPQSYISENQICLGRWCNKQRCKYKNRTLKSKKIELLEKIPVQSKMKHFVK